MLPLVITFFTVAPPTSFLNNPVLALPLVIFSVTVWPLPSKVPEKSLA